MKLSSEFLDVRNVDCMEMMRGFADKSFDLAIVDPPYGIGVASKGFIGTKKRKNALASPTNYGNKEWDSATPDDTYFSELLRVSKNQIIWGGNYFQMRPSPCWIVWDKLNGDNSFSDCELAWASFNTSVRKFVFRWSGMLQGDMLNKETRIHPTQKPVALYKWLLSKYAQEGQKILDTHMGSGSIAIACHYAKCHLVASELDSDYYKAACARIERETAQTTLGL